MAEVKHLDAKELPAVLKRVLNKSITIKTMYPPALSLHLWVPSFPRVPESPRVPRPPPTLPGKYPKFRSTRWLAPAREARTAPLSLSVATLGVLFGISDYVVG